MEKLLKNKWLMVAIGAVVLFFVWRRFGGTIGCYLNPNCDPNPEQTGAGANGSNYGLSPLYATGKMRSRGIIPGGSRLPQCCPTCPSSWPQGSWACNKVNACNGWVENMGGGEWQIHCAEGSISVGSNGNPLVHPTLRSR